MHSLRKRVAIVASGNAGSGSVCTHARRVSVSKTKQCLGRGAYESSEHSLLQEAPAALKHFRLVEKAEERRLRWVAMTGSEVQSWRRGVCNCREPHEKRGWDVRKPAKGLGADEREDVSGSTLGRLACNTGTEQWGGFTTLDRTSTYLWGLPSTAT